MDGLGKMNPAAAFAALVRGSADGERNRAF
jgi:hypothetical protein